MARFKITPTSITGAKAPYFFVEAPSKKEAHTEAKKTTRLGDFPKHWSLNISEQ